MFARGDEDDLIQAGNLGLLKALAKFDPTKGAWTQYAKQWIFDAMNTDVVEVRDIARTVGRRQRKMPRAVRRKAYRIQATFGRPATSEELGVSEADFATWTAPRPQFVAYEPTGSSRLTWKGVDFSLSVTKGPTILTPAFWRALASLSEFEARVLLALVVDEKPVNEVARSEGHEERWARATYRRAIEKMRAAMAVP